MLKRNRLVQSCIVSLFALILAGSLTACGSSSPATMVVMVVSQTPDPRLVAVTVTNTGEAKPTALPASPTLVNTDVPNATVNSTATSGAVPPAAVTSNITLSAPPPAMQVPVTNVTHDAPTAATTLTFGPTATSNAFPTDTRQQIFIAQEDYEHGYMFWIQASKDIWVLLPSKDPNAGEWRVFKDTFVDGEPEVDPSTTPPANLYQPRRGFGKLWRNNPDIRAALGWGTTPEFGINTSYVYQPGGYVNSNSQYVAGPGTHFLIALSRYSFEMHEPQPGQAYGTWKKVS